MRAANLRTQEESSETELVIETSARQAGRWEELSGDGLWSCFT